MNQSKQGRSTFLKVSVVLFLVIVISAFVLLLNKKKGSNIDSNSDQKENTACTLEARQCPDGSYVGRTGPDCEFAECPELEPNVSTSVNYDEVFAVKPNQQVMFSNGMILTLKEIDDQRCPKDVQCIWEGEYRVTLHVISPVDDVRTFTLGSVRESQQSYWGYTFSLQSVTDGEVMMVVSEE